jgi:hypothetical protein
MNFSLLNNNVNKEKIKKRLYIIIFLPWKADEDETD